MLMVRGGAADDENLHLQHWRVASPKDTQNKGSVSYSESATLKSSTLEILKS
jgi:hypothetical protein